MNKSLWDRMLDDVLKGNIITQKFNMRYASIVEPLVGLGWSNNCIEWSYFYNSGVTVSVISCYDGFELTMRKINRAMSRPVFNQQFDGYCNGTRSLLKGIHEFKGKVKTISLDKDNEGATVCGVDYPIATSEISNTISDSECCVKNANALEVLNTYKSKYSMSDSMWPVELERLQTLCGTTDIDVIANFIETNFL